MSYQVAAPIISGSGVAVVHGCLAAHLSDYRLHMLSPYWGLMPPALALLRSNSAGIVHTSPDLGPWCAGRDSTLVATFHGYRLDRENLDRASFAQRVFYRTVLSATVAASLRRARWVTTVSRFMTDLVRSRHALGDRLVMIRNGVDTQAFSPGSDRDDTQVRVLFAGNPRRQKGSDHLAALAQALPAGVVMQYTKRMRSSGLDGPLRSECLIALPARPHDQMPSLYRDSDILFFPTQREGFGLVVAEAMACGLPVVAARCSAIPELVDHGRGGFLFEPSDRGQMLEYLTRLSRDPALRLSMGAYNREKAVAEFPLAKMLDGYRQVFAACT